MEETITLVERDGETVVRKEYEEIDEFFTELAFLYAILDFKDFLKFMNHEIDYNVVEIKGFDTTEKSIYLEECEGDLLRFPKKIDPDTVFREMLHVIMLIKELNILHCDFKPENILVKGSSSYLCDFGIGTVTESDLRKMMELYTEEYRHPDINDENVKLTHFYDLWALTKTTDEIKSSEFFQNIINGDMSLVKCISYLGLNEASRELSSLKTKYISVQKIPGIMSIPEKIKEDIVSIWETLEDVQTRTFLHSLYLFTYYASLVPIKDYIKMFNVCLDLSIVIYGDMGGGDSKKSNMLKFVSEINGRTFIPSPGNMLSLNQCNRYFDKFILSFLKKDWRILSLSEILKIAK